MKFWKSAEWQRISKLRGLKLLLVGIAVIPSIYAVIFLSSLWDAYGNVNQLPVAIVNKDKSAKINKKTENLGNDLTKKLIRKQSLKFTEVSSKNAKDGLKNGKYYMTITIPSNFTRNAGTLLSDDPKTSNIVMSHNAGQSFIAEKMTSSAATKIQTAVNKSLQKVYIKTILSAINSSQKGLKSGSNGATTLSEGLGKIADGGNTLGNGATKLASGTTTLTTGLAQYTAGVSQANTGSSTLATGLSQYTSGVSQASSGTNTLVNGTTSAANGATKLASGTTQLASNMSLLESGSQQIALGAQQLADQLQKVSDQINEQQSAKSTDLNTLDARLEELTTRLSELSNTESPTIDIDSSKLNDASSALTSGLTGTAKDFATFKELASDDNFKKFLAENPTFDAKYQDALSDLGNNVQTSKTAANTIKDQLTALEKMLPQLQALQSQMSQLKELGKSGAVATQSARKAIKTLNDSLTTVSQGIANQAVPGAQKLADGATTLTTGQKKATTAVNQVNSAAGQLASGNSQLASGASQLSAGLNKLTANNSALNSGASQLNSGLSQLTANNDTLNSGAAQLKTGSQQLASGASQLVTSLQTAQSGTQTLAQKLADGAIKLSVINNKKGNVSALTQPVNSSRHNLSTVKNNGTGMTPYMMSVGLFVGMITFSAIYDFVTVAKKPRSGFAWWAQKQAVNIPVWIAQALILTTLLLLVNGLQPKNVPLLYVAALVVAFAFNQFVLLFSTLLGKLGSGLMIIALVLQLSASAGSYPIELSNGFFQAIHPWMPMTYSVHAFREAISIGGSLTGDLLVLLSIGVLSMVLTWGVYHWKLKHNNLQWSEG
ncbi:YhgE/Pip domain-containing protein [Leuconostoc lactis]|uniref:YhgE/Pip domain-containing protein n=1 Tax=Leuconostoc lactis TaxID=1246 RepID=UPI00020DA172|nr:YhgE/Pip domain-containing protein [Leuconostoc lactis]